MGLTLLAYAKINLTLEVLGKRADGYHEIASVLQTVSLADTLAFELDSRLAFRCDVPSLQSPDNLVLRAAQLLREVTGSDKGASIQLTKKIPIASGLGSGATDAAATLVGLNRLWELNLPLHRLIELAARLGSDVPFFLYGGTALAKGRGEKVTPLPPIREVWLVLLIPAIPPVPNKTAQLYSQLNPFYFTSGQFTQKLVEHLQKREGINASLLFNAFEQVAFNFFPRLSDYHSLFLKAGAESVHLSGAGPALFALVQDKAEGEAILSNLVAERVKAFLVNTPGAETSSLWLGDC